MRQHRWSWGDLMASPRCARLALLEIWVCAEGAIDAEREEAIHWSLVKLLELVVIRSI